MDAHTLNAWTRFALQKGGIGTATALVDNPATDIEDLMFMAGEKIIVLRRLDDTQGPDSAASSASGGDDAWYLGYCEGVVGRYRGSHVQIHGKLKKPVLMRRSGVGAVRDSTLRPMSKSEAAVMPASQVPPGIPINSVDSDDEDLQRHSVSSAVAGHEGSPSCSTRTTAGDSRRGSDAVAMYQSLATLPTSASYDAGMEKQDETFTPEQVSEDIAEQNPRNSTSKSQPQSAMTQGLASKMSRLGVTTPPSSDETHIRALRQRETSQDSDSDDSETHLPWARGSVSSVKSVKTGESASSSVDKSALAQKADVPDELRALTPTKGQRDVRPLRTNGLNTGSSSDFPPSPISSAESQLLSRNNNAGAPLLAPNNDGVPSNAVNRTTQRHKGHTESTDTTTTESSGDAPQRHLNTFSIYDIYGRDSIAMPNFDFRNLNGAKTNSLGARLAPASRNDGPASRSTPTSPQVPQRLVSQSSTNQPAQSAQGSSQGRSPPVLRVPSQRRPVAAPPVASIGTMPSPRPPVDVAAQDMADARARGQMAPSSQTTSEFAGQRAVNFGSPDPYRPPPNLSALRKPSIARDSGAISPGKGSLREEPSRFDIGSRDAAGQQQGQTSNRLPIGSNLMARRMRENSLASMNSNSNSSEGLRISVPGSGSSPSRSTGQNAGSSPLPSPLNGPLRPFAHGANGMPSPRGTGSLVTLRQNSSHSLDAGRGSANALTPPFATPAKGQIGHDPAGRSPSPLSGASGGSLRSPRSPLLPPHPGALLPQRSSQSSPRPSLQIQTSMSPQLNVFAQQAAPGSSPRKLSQASSPGVGNVVGSGVRQPDLSTLKFDEMGFVLGSSPPIPLPLDDAEDTERWRRLADENDLVSAKKGRKVRKMVERGIPRASRQVAWSFLLQSTLRRRNGLFEELCKMSQSSKGKKGKEEIYAIIEKDIERAFPDHRMFIGERRTGQADLEAILKAYVHFNPKVGYVQGLNLVAGFFLVLMPAEDAFWMLCALLRDVHVEGYYEGDMKQLHVDGIVFGNLLQSMDPELAGRLQELGIEPIHFAPNWILPLFVRILPWPTLLRVWDMFFYEGPSWVLRVALAIVRILRDPLMDRRVCPGHGEALRLLLHPPLQVLTPENVVPCALSVKIKDGEVRKLSRQASKIVRQTNLDATPISVGPIDGPDRSRSLGGSSSSHDGRSPSAMSSHRMRHQEV